MGGVMKSEPIDFAFVFDRLAANGLREETIQLGGVDVRLVRLAGAGEGRWDHHDHSTETVVVWSGDFTVEFCDRTLRLSAGQCCVVPVGAEHRGLSSAGAEIILFQKTLAESASV
jgi:mannose-6-phosphate isomerase-like protein (cupin superfamily)